MAEQLTQEKIACFKGVYIQYICNETSHQISLHITFQVNFIIPVVFTFEGNLKVHSKFPVMKLQISFVFP